MELGNLIPILAILAGAIAVVIVLRHFMHRRAHRAAEVPPAQAAPRPASPSLSEVEEEYLDSSHIITRPVDPRDPPR